MDTFVGSLFSAGFAGILVWWMMRRDASQTPGSSTAVSGVNQVSHVPTTEAEIKQLQAAIDDLMAALEDRADSAAQRLTDTIAAAQAAQALLDRSLTSLVENRPAATAPEPASQASSGAPGIRFDTVSAASMPEGARMGALPHVGVPTADVASSDDRESSGAAGTRVGEVSGGAMSDGRRTAALSHSGAESSVSAGVRNSVEIARRTGLPRGEVELILNLQKVDTAPSSRPGPEEDPAAPSKPLAVAGDMPLLDDSDSVADLVPRVVNEAVPVLDDRYAAIYAVVAAGITNTVEIARRTGLGRGEVELHMGLHARNVL
jgi:hypothetical protein